MGSSYRQDLNSGHGEPELEGHLRLALKHLGEATRLAIELAHEEDQYDNAVDSGALFGRLILAAHIVETELPKENNICPTCMGMRMLSGDLATKGCPVCRRVGRIYKDNPDA